MKKKNLQYNIQTLIGDILKTLSLLEKINSKYAVFSVKRSVFSEGFDLMILAEIVSDYYTCLETAFVRISKFFENNVDKSKWHSDLLEKMTIDVPGIRKALLSELTYAPLKDIMRFRHFKTYYFEMEYDKDRIDFIEKKFLQSFPLVVKSMKDYILFLESLIKE